MDFANTKYRLNSDQKKKTRKIQMKILYTFYEFTTINYCGEFSIFNIN